MGVATIIFFTSLALIVALFAVTAIEAHTGVRLARSARARADRGALRIKEGLMHARDQLEALPPRLGHGALYVVAQSALVAASCARACENQAHRLADFVSAKRGFERRETTSTFLKQVPGFRNEKVEESENI